MFTFIIRRFIFPLCFIFFFFLDILSDLTSYTIGLCIRIDSYNEQKKTVLSPPSVEKSFDRRPMRLIGFLPTDFVVRVRVLTVVTSLGRGLVRYDSVLVHRES